MPAVAAEACRQSGSTAIQNVTDHSPDTLDSARTGSGYASPHYAQSLHEFGEPLALPGSGGWLLRRNIPLTAHHDAMGCYPLFSCIDWERLGDDLAALTDSLVSVTIVTDPFAECSEKTLHDCFPDLCVKYKDHYVVDLDRMAFESLSSHHRRNVRRGLREVTTEFCTDPPAHLDDWCRLYDRLIRRHDITGLAAFSDESFRSQLTVPGLFMQRALHEDQTVGMILWYVNRGVAYYHLGAYSERGYELRASYALFWKALDHFRGRARWAALGAAAGARPGEGGGLDRFKAGWATTTRPAFLCGRILSHERYSALCTDRKVADTDYFPAYRAGEFR